MTTLQGFPMVNQRTTVTGDGRPSENALYDCVAACVDAMCRYWLNTPENSVFNPDHFKDVAYGEAWRNDGTDAARYVDFCKTLGINLDAVSTSSAGHLVDIAHEYLQQGKPVMFTELDPYVDTSLSQYAGWTHACCWFADDANGLTALDPFIGKALYKTDSAWIPVLRSNQLWIAERIPMGTPSGWRDDGATLWSPNTVQGGPEVPITGPFRDYILAANWPANNVALEVGHHVDVLELSSAAGGPCAGSGWQQLFRYAWLGKPDGGPLAGKVVWEWLGLELAHFRAKYAEAQAEIAALKAIPAGLDANAVANRLQAIALEATNGANKISQLATQPF